MARNLIEATDLRSANSDDTFGERFPELIDRLVRVSVDDPDADIRFLYAGTGKVSGRDGHTNCKGGRNVPPGKAIWEIKTSTGVRADANSDYEKRKAEYASKPIEGKSTTFIYVTSRTWGGHKTEPKDMEAWCEQKRAEGVFKDVLAYDCQTIIDWLATAPSVARWARSNLLGLGKHDTGFETLDEYLTQFGLRFSFSFSDHLLLAGREDQVEALRNTISEGGGPYKLVAETEQEAVAFVAAAINGLTNEDVRRRLMSSSLHVRSKEVLEELSYLEDHIIVVNEVSAEEAHRLAPKNKIILVAGFGVRDEDSRLLVRDQSRFGEGLQACGFDSSDSYDLSGKCGRSISVLARMRPAVKNAMPAWSQGDEPRQSFAKAMCLIGAFNVKHAGDIEVLDSLFDGQMGAEWRLKARPYLQAHDPLIRRAGDVVSLVSNVEAMTWIGPWLGTFEFDALDTAFVTVFGHTKTRDPNAIVEIGAAQEGYSAQCRLGIAQTMTILNALGDQMEIAPYGNGCAQYVKGVIGKLPKGGEYARFIAANRESLRYIAEADPAGFFDALETLFEGKSDAALSLFETHEDFMGIRWADGVQNAIWALTMLAWNPAYFERAALLLARFSEIDPTPELNHGAHPKDALFRCLSSWAPQTDASIALRKQVLDRIVQEHKEVGIEVLLDVLPDQRGAVSSHSKPAFYSSTVKSLTWQQVWDFEAYAGRRLLVEASDSPDTLRRGISGLIRLEISVFNEALLAFEAILDSSPPEATGEFWNALQAETARHERFSESDWSIDSERVTALKALVEKFKPDDPVERYVRLFGWDGDADLMDDEDSLVQLKRTRRNAIKEIYDYGGSEGVVRFARRIEQPFVALALLAEEIPIDGFFELVREGAASGFDSWLQVGGEIAAGLFGASAIGWLEAKRKESNLSHKEYVRILAGMVRDRSARAHIWSLDKSTQNDVWRETMVFPSWIDEDEQSRSVESWIDAGKAHSVLKAPRGFYERLPTETLLRLARATISALSSDGGATSGFSLRDYLHVLEIAKRRDGVSTMDIALLEYPFIRQSYLAEKYEWQVHRLLRQSPQFFLDCLVNAYRPDDYVEGAEDSGVDTKDGDEGRRIHKQNDFFVLYNTDHAGFVEDGRFNIDAFKLWVDEVFALAEEKKRVTGAKNTIGKILAHTPPTNVNEVWPSPEVAEAIELLSSSEVEHAIAIARSNMRGAFSGSGEAHYNSWADRLDKCSEQLSDYPRTSALLRAMANEDRKSAEWSRVREDESNSQSQL